MNMTGVTPKTPPLAAGQVYSQTKAKEHIEQWKGEGKVTVALSGSFDLIHVGHVNMLREARAQGDALIVLLNSDESVRGYKGPIRPLIPERERAEMLAAIRYVDAVVLFDELTPLTLLAELKPDVLVNGSDYGPDCIERPVVEGYGGRIHIVERDPSMGSTTVLIQKIQDLKTN